MHRHARNREVVIAHRVHAHHRKQPPQRGQLLRRADPDRTMPLQIQPRALVVALQPRRQCRIGLQGLRVDVGHQGHQVAIQRHLGAIHVRHGLRKQAADLVRGNKHGLAHGTVLAVPATADVAPFSPTLPAGGQLHGSIGIVCWLADSSAARRRSAVLARHAAQCRVIAPCRRHRQLHRSARCACTIALPRDSYRATTRPAPLLRLPRWPRAPLPGAGYGHPIGGAAARPA